jgi:CRISPR-associated endonuclease Csn1
MKTMNKRILGIDTGTNSLGWAVVERNDKGEYTLLRKGSYIFQEGVKVEKGIESSKAAERTSHRATRKHYFRRRLRKIEVLKTLIKYGWCPELSEEQLHLWHTKKQYPVSDSFIAWQRTNENLEQNPYYYRHVCLHDKLDLTNKAEAYILGRALYHLAQRRGFLSNRLDQSEEDESGAVKSSISNLSKEMKNNGCEYLGDYFYKLYSEQKNNVRIRNRYTDREAHYKKEFYAICKKQELTDTQITELEKALYFQRPLKSQRQGVGKCTFEPRKPRCADSHPDFEKFRMLTFLNNVKIKGPKDIELRNLNEEEIKKALPMFYRKSKDNFDFADIAKSIAGKDNYQYIKDAGDKPYKFNYRMTQGVSGCRTTAQLREIFGEDYANGIAEVYVKGDGKTPQQMVNDVWNVLYSFPDKEKVKQWAKDNLQLDEEMSEKFSKIKLSHNFASLSLNAIRNIIPWLEKGLIYSHAVTMAKIPDIVGHEVWQEHKETITNELIEFILNFNPKDENMQGTLDYCIKDYLKNNFDLKPNATDVLYHPSMIETYPDAKKNKDGIYQLGSPRTNAVRNPMAMRSLHQLRKVINELLREGVIDNNTEVHIEYARELNDANKRWAIGEWNKRQEKKRKEAYEEIKKRYKEETKKNIEPTDDDITRFLLWKEQNTICIYTNATIKIKQIVGPDPDFDIEHTIPRSIGGENIMSNFTLCSKRYNRDVKKAKMPTELSPADYEGICTRISAWKEKIEKLRKELDKKRTNPNMAKDIKDKRIREKNLLKIELDYWKDKYNRFIITEAPDGFARRQGAGIGLVGKYAGLYLKTLFHKKEDRNKTNVRTIKGTTTAEFRKMWGLQDDFEKKSRNNHIHHCIDAIVVACIDTGSYNQVARYYQQLEEYERNKNNKPSFPKPWPTFTEDIMALKNEILVVHDTPDNMPKHARKYVRTANGKVLAKGDCARGSLHNDTYYGAIERDGEIRYVVRKSLSDLKENDIENIVDETVKSIIKQAIANKDFKKAMAEDIFMNKEKGILIKKVRCYVPTVTSPLHIRHQRDTSKNEYKRQYHVTIDGNYCMAIYEGEIKGKTKRSYEIVNMLDAAAYFKKSANLTQLYPIAPENKNGLNYRCFVRTGTHIILLQSDEEEIDVTNEKELAKRLYFVAVMQKDGRIVLRYHQDAREATILKKERKAGAYKDGENYRSEISLSLSDFHALVEGIDFKINALGEITMLR